MEKLNFAGYEIKNATKYEIQLCYTRYISPDDTPWHVRNTFMQDLPVFATQLAVGIFIMHLLIIVLKPLRQPRFAAELLTSILVGPSALERLIYWKSEDFKWTNIFPMENSIVLETFANLGVTYYMFLVGLEMDLSVLRHMEMKSWSIAIAGILIPFFIGGGLYYVPIHKDLKPDNNLSGAAFCAITLSITSFPDLARTLSDIKLLQTELGRTALTSAVITDISTWVFLAAAITISNNYQNDHNIVCSMFPIICFVIVCCFALRPSIAWWINRTKNEPGKFRDTHIYFFLIGVVVCGIITDSCGSHSLVGGFMFGLIIPKGELAIEIMEKTEEFVSGILLPSFIISSGRRTNFSVLLKHTKWPYLAMITLIATSAKIVSTVQVSAHFGMSLKEGLTLGGLMNSKGVLALIVLNEGRSIKSLDNIYVGVMVLSVLFMTCLVGPIVFLVNRTENRSRLNKLRTIQHSDPDAELRMLACIHSVQNLSGIIRLLEVSNATENYPIRMFAAHLVELIERESAMLIVHEKLKTYISSTRSRKKGLSEDIFSAFENYKMENEAVSVHPLTVLSPYTTMHEDIFRLVEDNAVKLVLIPFHKQVTADGGLGGNNHSIKEVNKKLLAKAPCSVGIFVDRGLGSSKSFNSLSSGRSPKLRLAMFFIGGPDDHEALSFAWRMAGEQGVTLIVVRFRLVKDVEVNRNDENEICISKTGEEFDNDYLYEFRFKAMCHESIIYIERTVKNSDEVEEAIRKQYNNFDLYIVGRGIRKNSPLTKGLIDWGYSSELGPVGDTLVSSKFTAHASVLVLQVQQSVSNGYNATLKRSRSKLFEQKKWASPILNPNYEAINVHDSN